MDPIQAELCRVFDGLSFPAPDELNHAVDTLEVNLQDILPHTGEPGTFPYQRKLLYKSEHVEVLVMNWAVRQPCSPHDHGRSFGTIKVLAGEVEHDLYTLDQNDIPRKYFSRTEQAGSTYFAARGMIHAMGNPHDGPAITLHTYAPPIEGMKVYDLHRCLVCTVSDDCGAWWPDQQRQQLEILKIGRSHLVE
ncbi:cysteine dioxygenase [Nocardia niigatensis]